MGVQLKNNNALSRRGNRRAPMSEINVTPFVDVVLVLLIIFMVAAPLMTSGVHVDLPETSASPVEGQDEPLSISIDAKGQIYIQNTKVKADELVPKLMAISKQKKDTRIFVRGDKTVPYGEIMQVVSSVSSAGFNKVAFVTENPGQQ